MTGNRAGFPGSGAPRYQPRDALARARKGAQERRTKSPSLPVSLLSLPRALVVRGSLQGIGGGGLIDGKLGAWICDVSPVRSSANLNSTGPSISLMATVAMARARKPVPMLGNSRAMIAESPSARPACDTRPDHD